jgi:acyl-CoA thioester hydrolase
MTDNITELLAKFKFEMPIPMRWNDLDPIGHVNNVYYFEYFQLARGIYFPTVSKDWDWKKHMFVIAHISCDYYKELTLTHQQVTIKARTVAISTKSFEMEYIITSIAKDGTTILHAKGKSVNVMVDLVAKKSTEVPDWLREAIINYEPAL